MIHFQGAVFCVSSSMQLIVKLLRPGRIIPAFFFFATNQSQAIFWRRLFSAFASRVCVKGSGKWERSNTSRLKQIVGVKAMAESPWVRQVSRLPTHMVHSWEGAVMIGSLFGTQVDNTQSAERGEVWNGSKAFLYCHLKLYQDIFCG